MHAHMLMLCCMTPSLQIQTSVSISLMPARLCLHRVREKSGIKDLARPKEVMMQRPIGSQDVIARVCPAGHQGVHYVRQKDGNPLAQAVPHPVDERPTGGLQGNHEA